MEEISPIWKSIIDHRAIYIIVYYQAITIDNFVPNLT